jgi:hypothetical protein
MKELVEMGLVPVDIYRIVSLYDTITKTYTIQ